MGEHPRDKIDRIAANVVHDDRHHEPAALLQSCRLHSVVLEGLGIGMPLGTVVLRDKPRLWPCEVNPPLLSAPVDDDVLEFGQRKPAVDEYQPCFAFHGGFCSSVG